jgi:hypothetical protein
MENIIDTRDLAERRDELKTRILDAFNYTFFTELDCCPDIETLSDNIPENATKEDKELFFSDWKDEINEINEIDEIEHYCPDFEFGCTLIHYDYFTEYTKELLIDCGYISKDFPTWIEIDWNATAENVMYDYSEINYRGETYLFR